MKDGGTTVNAVLASSLTPVTTSAPLYDTRLAVDGGCDPDGCAASNTLVGDALSNTNIPDSREAGQQSAL